MLVRVWPSSSKMRSSIAEMLRERFFAAGSFHSHVVELEMERVLVHFALRLLGFARVLGVEVIEVVPQLAESPDAGAE